VGGTHRQRGINLVMQVVTEINSDYGTIDNKPQPAKPQPPL